MKTYIVDGIRFTKSNGKIYHYNSKLRKHMHQYVWEKENGPTPKGWEIHHIDGDTDNNDISNLQAMPMLEHKAIHAEKLRNDPERLEKMRINLDINARPKANEWHGSKEGREWHKRHYEEHKQLLHQKKKFICEQCNSEFVGVDMGKNRFCSKKCKSKWRRDSGLDDVIRVCDNCNKEFTINKYSKTRNCSKKCAAIQRSKKRKDSLNLQEKQL